MYQIEISATRSNTNTQLSLALAWDRPDIAKNEIFTASNKTNYQVIHMYQAIKAINFLLETIAFLRVWSDEEETEKKKIWLETMWEHFQRLLSILTPVFTNIR